MVVDIRAGPPQFGRWISVVLSADNHREIFVPAGFAHGFCTSSESAQFLYERSDFYHPEAEHGVPHASLIRFVEDRPGHDHRYAMDIRKIQAELGWRPTESFETGIRKTVQWYLEHQSWVENVTSGAYKHWMQTNYALRLSV